MKKITVAKANKIIKNCEPGTKANKIFNGLKSFGNDEIVNKIQKTYLNARKHWRQQPGIQENKKHKAFRLFSLDATDLDVLENIESQNGEIVDAEIQKRGIDQDIISQQKKYTNAKHAFKKIRKMLKEAKEKQDDSIVKEAITLLKTIHATNEEIRIEKIKVSATINALYKMDLNDES